MGPVDQMMTQHMWRERDRDKNYFERVQQLVGTDQVQCVTLDQIWEQSSEPIDILKIDAEGGELEVLKGAELLLKNKRIHFIFSEFLLAPYYTPRVTLGHQQVFLDELGYRLIAINDDHFPYSWRRTDIRSVNDRWLTYAGDAMFVVDPDRNELDEVSTYRLGLACIAMGFNAFGLNLLREAGKVSARDFESIEAQANRPPFGRRLRTAWSSAPHIAVRLLSRLGLHT
jgi:methyltransferase FkbM-like protein